MTTQANAYYANKLKERELEEVKIPELGLKTRQFNEVDKPKVAISAFEAEERARSNRANEGLKSQELAETQRYNQAREGLTLRELNIKENTSLTREEQMDKQILSDYGRIFSKGDYKNAYGALNALGYSAAVGKYGTAGGQGGMSNGRNTNSNQSGANVSSATYKPGSSSGNSLVNSSKSDTEAYFRIGFSNRPVTEADHPTYDVTDPGSTRHKSRNKRNWNENDSILNGGIKGAVPLASYAKSLNG